MGYSKNPDTLNKIRGHLLNLEDGLATEWKVPEDKTDWWAYKVREGLSIARLYPTRFPKLAEAAQMFKVVIAGAGIVRAVLAGNTPEPVVSAAGGNVQHGLDTDHAVTGDGGRRSTATVTGPQTADSIMRVWFAQQPSNNPIYFPDAALSNSELLTLHELASEQNLIFFESFGAITVQRRTADLVEFAWDPMDLEDEDDIL